MSVQLYWTQIKEIRYGFEPHTLSKYSDCHSSLDILSSYIDLPPSLFIEDKITLEQATLVKDFTTRLRNAVVNDIIDFLMNEPPSFNNDNAHITSLFAESTMKYKDDNRYMRIQTARSFIKAGQKAIAGNKDYIDIFFGINHWHFN